MIPKNKAASERDRIEAEACRIECAMDEKILSARGDSRGGSFYADIEDVSQEVVDLVAKRYRDGGWYVTFTARCDGVSSKLIGMRIKFEPSEIDLSHEKLAAHLAQPRPKSGS